MARKRAKQKKPEGMDQHFWEEVLAGKRCGAKKKHASGFCRNRPYLAPSHQEGEGPWRCRAHGGVVAATAHGAPIGNQNAKKHGIYANALSDEEKALWPELDTNSLDAPIRMTMIRLQRAFVAEYEQQVALAADPETDHALFLTERKVMTGQDEEGGELTQRTTVRKRYDYHPIIDRLVNQLCKLITQKAMLEGDDVEPNDVAQKVRDAIGQVRGTPQAGRFLSMPLEALGVRNIDQN